MMRIIIKISEKAYNALTHTEFDANDDDFTENRNRK